MCTLTIIEQPGGYRVVVNRDEKRTRPLASAPQGHRAGAVRALWPTDTLAGGTWISSSDRGLTLSVQNVNPTPPPSLPETLVSRGEIIPRLIGSRSAWAATTDLKRMHLDLHAPFRLVAVDESEIVEARWDRTSLEIRRRELGPVCFVTSGLGDCLATPRLGLWELFLGEHGQTAAMQDEFHRHYWPDRQEISVHMTRADARTVSTTAVDVRFDADPFARVRMTHRDDQGIHRADLQPHVVGEARAATGRVAAQASRSDHRGAW